MADFRRWKLDPVDDQATRAVQQPPGSDARIARELTSRSAASKGDELDKSGPTTSMKQQALFAHATSPFKMVGMMGFMMWMSGSQLHIFSIMTTLSGVYQPLSAILSSGSVFRDDDGGKLDIVTPRALYCSIHMAGLLFALYRLNGMGMLPTHVSDFASALLPPRAAEFSAGGVVT